MTSFYTGSDLYLDSRTSIDTHLDLRLIRDPAILVQCIRQSPAVGKVGDVAREMGILLAEFVPGVENARGGVNEGALWRDISN